MTEDHFVKVRGLIKDLIAKLRSDALAEESQKNFCDGAMSKNIKKRDAANAQIEKANAAVTSLTARKNALEDEIATLESQIAELKKGLLEATELRNEDKAKNIRTMEMAQAGADSVELALSILREFYDKSFLQTHKYAPAGGNRDGRTVQDLAPDTGFDSKYNGAKEESKGIVGLLEIILTDFERTKVQAKADEEESLAAFESMEKDTNGDSDEKNERIKMAENELKDAEASILEQTTEFNNGQSLLDGALEELASLEAMCVKGEETYEERVQKRKQEIQALKDALEILENWQS
jgi:chromosome segregation ATPase